MSGKSVGDGKGGMREVNGWMIGDGYRVRKDVYESWHKPKKSKVETDVNRLTDQFIAAAKLDPNDEDIRAWVIETCSADPRAFGQMLNQSNAKLGLVANHVIASGDTSVSSMKPPPAPLPRQADTSVPESADNAISLTMHPREFVAMTAAAEWAELAAEGMQPVGGDLNFSRNAHVNAAMRESGLPVLNDAQITRLVGPIRPKVEVHHSERSIFSEYEKQGRNFKTGRKLKGK